MLAGYAEADITPRRPMTLSGFVARCERPFETVDDRLTLRVLAVEGDNGLALLLAYDLLAIGLELHGELAAAVDERLGRMAPAAGCVLCTTHTHSAPAAVTLLGCGRPERDYSDLLVARTAAAVSDALAARQDARVHVMTRALPGLAYNRRQVLADGRVVMSPTPDTQVARAGPVWDRMVMARFEREDGAGIAGVLSWAAHPVLYGGPNVTCDYPGHLCRRFAEREGFPFMFLQGGCGDINPAVGRFERKDLLTGVAAIMERIDRGRWAPPAGKAATSAFASAPIDLAYGPLPAPEALEKMRRGMGEIAERGDGPREMLATLADIMNVRPGDPIEPAMLRHIAATMRLWSEQTLPVARRGHAPPCELQLAAWKLGDVVFLFAAAELFTQTALRLQDAFPDQLVCPVGYASPLVGYLPTDAALDEGGYEADYAYRFYGHPAPFARGSEAAVRRRLQELTGAL